MSAPGCRCAEVQAADPRRHFKECPLREPLPEQDQTAIDGEATARQRLRSAFEGYVAWQAAECARRGIPPDGWADARTFAEWVRDEVLVGPDAESYLRRAP